MNHLLGFIVRVTEKLLDLYLKILVAILSFFGRALARVIADIYVRFHKPTRSAPYRRRSFERRRGNSRRR